MNAIHKHIADAGMLAKATGDKDTAHILMILVDAHQNDYVEDLKVVCQKEYMRQKNVHTEG